MARKRNARLHWRPYRRTDRRAFSFSAINYVGRIATVNATDAVSIANTYIVYTTFVIAAVALLLTVAGLIFTQHFAVEKEAHIAHCIFIGVGGRAL